jgi:hypothetical protein
VSLHHPRTESLLDEEALLAGAPDEDATALVDALVCDHCFDLVYPDGNCDEEYLDPDVFWPCPTERERQLERENLHGR